VRRNYQGLPWTNDGLGLTQRLILRLLADGAQTAGQVFHKLMLKREPLPWMADLIIQDIVEGMRGVEHAVFTGSFEEEDRRWAAEILTITRVGRAVLAGMQTGYPWLLAPDRWVACRSTAPHRAGAGTRALHRR
jgi:hypothetical protein